MDNSLDESHMELAPDTVRDSNNPCDHKDVNGISLLADTVCVGCEQDASRNN